ncbi:MAG: hypothetical protein ACAH80_17630 [Alphaproteobacteria bacterium]
MSLRLLRKQDTTQLSDAEIVDSIDALHKYTRRGIFFVALPVLALALPLVTVSLPLMLVGAGGMLASVVATMRLGDYTKELEKRGLEVDNSAEAPAKNFSNLSPTFNPEAAVTLGNTVKAMPRIKIKQQPGAAA